MKLRIGFVPAVMALSWAAVLDAQQSFVQTSVSSVVSCVSTGKERQQCPADTRAGIVMLRPTGQAACLLGRNWGYDDQGVWVSEGCGGDFGTGSSSRAAAPSSSSEAVVKSEDEIKQIETTTTGINPALVYHGAFQPYGSLRTIISIPANGPAEVQDDASRVGINFTTFGPIRVFAGTEWAVNLVQSETSLNVGATTASGFGEVEKTTQPVFGARLGFVGVDLGKFGRLSYGKQLSTHYDIASYTTDRFNVFGGQSTATYVAGTDGGQSGTARADQTILYHLTLRLRPEVEDLSESFRDCRSVAPTPRPISITFLQRWCSMEVRITGPLEAKAPGATLSGEQTGSTRSEATLR
jgi:Outer membrane protein (porin)